MKKKMMAVDLRRKKERKTLFGEVLQEKELVDACLGVMCFRPASIPLRERASKRERSLASLLHSLVGDLLLLLSVPLCLDVRLNRVTVESVPEEGMNGAKGGAAGASPALKTFDLDS